MFQATQACWSCEILFLVPERRLKPGTRLGEFQDIKNYGKISGAITQEKNRRTTEKWGSDRQHAFHQAQWVLENHRADL